MRHTPGPWTLNDGTLMQDSGRKLHLGKFSESPGLGDAAAANARLICAAPAMLEALQRCAAILARYPKHDDAWTQARAAIRAATGE